MRVVADHEAWRRIVRAPDLTTLAPCERGVAKTVTHDAIHFLQISTASYLYLCGVLRVARHKKLRLIFGNWREMARPLL